MKLYIKYFIIRKIAVTYPLLVFKHFGRKCYYPDELLNENYHALVL